MKNGGETAAVTAEEERLPGVHMLGEYIDYPNTPELLSVPDGFERKSRKYGVRPRQSRRT
jgi:hypothetical protein